MIDTRDLAYLDMAEALAVKALGATRPNPHVGAVVVRDGRIVGSGFHAAAGKPHAEIIALQEAGDQARRATLYLSLEPCIHWGRTPPCCESVLASGVRRVVVANLDPNPAIHGRGVRNLRRAGIAVDVAGRPERKSGLNEMHAAYIVNGRPFVTLKAALSADGKLATRTGEARWVSSPEAREYAHFLRSENDAILVGAGTVAADDPRLTVRPPGRKGKPIHRAILDPKLQLPAGARLLEKNCGGPVLVYTRSASGDSGHGRRMMRLRGLGAEVVPVPENRGRLDLRRVLADLARREIAGLLVEGGGRTASAFLSSGLVDKAVFMIAPLLIGGPGAVGLWEGAGTSRLSEALRFVKSSAFRLGGDLVVEGYF
ncbi:MAG: bifunctional diaminohydroxyphosphoribosylaminopyrimidine deaminase/5-amino-6-(5-phosphoribosylamino)uracil reductase RibD [Candidatus Aminicenantes bacterium]|nr:bifunctional diaminohydroxyphosphoribosylaminopyrimidine deaminase/5-amino-6-(5-phosphoribosylamino)uracil reductase RibD [Candidatus Aminicenantes bacterium]